MGEHEEGVGVIDKPKPDPRRYVATQENIVVVFETLSKHQLKTVLRHFQIRSGKFFLKN